jgi:hypothetical protein
VPPVEAREGGLLGLMRELEPGWRVPVCLEWVELLERAARGEAVRGLCAVPIRGGKTEGTNMGIVYALRCDPTRRIIHLTHSHQRATDIGKRVRALARAAGVGPERGWDTIESSVFRRRARCGLS